MTTTTKCREAVIPDSEADVRKLAAERRLSVVTLFDLGDKIDSLIADQKWFAAVEYERLYQLAQKLLEDPGYGYGPGLVANPDTPEEQAENARGYLMIGDLADAAEEYDVLRDVLTDWIDRGEEEHCEGLRVEAEIDEMMERAR